MSSGLSILMSSNIENSLAQDFPPTPSLFLPPPSCPGVGEDIKICPPTPVPAQKVMFFLYEATDTKKSLSLSHTGVRRTFSITQRSTHARMHTGHHVPENAVVRPPRHSGTRSITWLSVPSRHAGPQPRLRKQRPHVVHFLQLVLLTARFRRR